MSYIYSQSQLEEVKIFVESLDKWNPDALSITDSNVPTRYSGLLGIGATRCSGISVVPEISVIVRGLGPRWQNSYLQLR